MTQNGGMIMSVSSWLAQLGLPEYSSLLTSSYQKVQEILHLSECDLRELGVRNAAHRAHIMSSLSMLRDRERRKELKMWSLQGASMPTSHRTSLESAGDLILGMNQNYIPPRLATSMHGTLPRKRPVAPAHSWDACSAISWGKVCASPPSPISNHSVNTTPAHVGRTHAAYEPHPLCHPSFLVDHLAAGDRPQLFSERNTNMVGSKQRDQMLCRERLAMISPEKSLKQELEEELKLNREDPRSHAWHHGSISRERAEMLLIKDGDFLVRDSLSRQGDVVLTCRWAGKPLHFMIEYCNSTPDMPEPGYRLEHEVFRSVPALIRAHIGGQLPLSKCTPAFLGQPVLRSVPLRCLSSKHVELVCPATESSNRWHQKSGGSFQTCSSSGPCKSNQGLPEILSGQHSADFMNVEKNTAQNLSSWDQVSRFPSQSVTPPIPPKLFTQCTRTNPMLPSSCPSSPSPVVQQTHVITQNFLGTSDCLEPVSDALNKILWDDIDDIKRSSPQKDFPGKDEIADRLKGSIPPIHWPGEVEIDGLLKGFDLQSDWPDDRTKLSGPPSCDGPDTEPYHWLIAPSQVKLGTPSQVSSRVEDVAQMGDSTDNMLEFVWPEEEKTSSFHPLDFSSLLLPGPNKPLEVLIMRRVKELVSEQSPDQLARYIALENLKVARIIDVSAEQARCMGTSSGLELITLPHGRQLREDLLERFCLLSIGLAVDVLGCTGSVEERAHLVHRYVRTACTLWKPIGDLYGFAALMAGLEMTQVSRLEQTWSAVRQVHTNTALLYDSQLRPFMHTLREGKDFPSLSNTSFPHILPLLIYLDASVNHGHTHSMIPDDDGTPEALDTLIRHLQATREAAKQADACRKHAEAQLGDFDPDPFILETFKTDFQLRLFWGSQGCVAAAPDRYAKFNQILSALSAKLEPVNQHPSEPCGDRPERDGSVCKRTI
uniref:breast cancer anti-estrogen resistance protein 3 homolog isoform X1 n=3 Tax=Myxine glutinosa TaxID=7769 RepID=UPI00358E75FD